MGARLNCCKKEEEDDPPCPGARPYDQHQAEKAVASGGSKFNDRKSLVTKLIDIALLLANISQLDTLLDQGPSHKRFYILLVMIISSILLQVVFAIFELVIFRIGAFCDSCNPDTDKIPQTVSNPIVIWKEINDDDTETSKLIQTQISILSSVSSTNTPVSTPDCTCSMWKTRFEFINKVIMLVIIICNAFITGFGVSSGNKKCK